MFRQIGVEVPKIADAIVGRARSAQLAA